MTKPQQRTAIMIFVVLAAFSAIGVWAMRTQVHVFEVDGTITSIDVAERTATVEFIDPRNGHQKEMARPIPDACVVTLNGAPAALDELKPGDQAHVKASYQLSTKILTPLLLAVTRQDDASPSASDLNLAKQSDQTQPADTLAGN